MSATTCSARSSSTPTPRAAASAKSPRRTCSPPSAWTAPASARPLDENAEMPCGNAYSSIDDVFRFTEVLRGRGTAHGQRVLSPALFDYARKNHTGDLLNDAVVSETEARHLDSVPAKYTLLGGYTRGTGHHLTPIGQTASPDTFGAVGGASTGWIIDPQRDLTVIFLSAGFIEGLDHMIRLQRINDLALAAVED
ncbi:serine hydrolase [Streptomyces sp. NBC_01352]|nr:serine hydrolase [Streptomyces sp. NBC_01352]